MLIKRMRKNKKKGFTLVELIIVIAVIAILAVVMTTAFSGVTDNALRTRVMSQVNTFVNEVTTEVTSHKSGQCRCGGNKKVYECPTIAEVIGSNGYTGYVYTKTGSGIAKDFYVALDEKDQVKVATWPVDYAEIGSKTGLLILDNEGNPLFAVYARGSKYYFYSLYTADFVDGTKEYTASEASDWNMYVGKINEFDAAAVNVPASTDIHEITAA